MECCGHDGTYAMKVEGFEAEHAVGQKAFDEMKEAAAEVWATDCPLAAIQFQQHAGVKPMHPMTILARAYREDGFETKLEAKSPAKRQSERDEARRARRDPRLRDLRRAARRSARRRCARRPAPRPRRRAPDVPVREPRHHPLPGPGDDARRAHRPRGRHPARARDLQRAARRRGELGATLLIEIDDPARAPRSCAQWLELPEHLYAKLEDGEKACARFDERQVGDTALSSVQYLKFEVGAEVPVAVGCDHPDPELRHETELTPEQRAALQRDLSE